MKRYIFLTSVLALTACGGGSGGSGGVNGNVAQPTFSQPVSSTASTSNREITNLTSEILVGANGHAITPGTRSGSVSYNGQNYISYRLDDVKLWTAENLNKNPQQNPSYLQLELDNATGRIEAIKMKLGDTESGRTVRDTTDTTVFQGPIFEYVPDGDDQAIYRIVDNGQTWQDLLNIAANKNLTGGHWNRIDERMAVETYGKNIGQDENGDDIKLQYADFGHFNPVYKTKNKELTEEVLAAIRAGTLAYDSEHVRRDENGDALDKQRSDEEFAAELAEEDYQLMAGGYAIEGRNLKDTLTPNVSTSYTGKAIGRIYTSIGNEQQTGVTEANRAAVLEMYGYQNTDPTAPFYYQTDDSEAPNYVMDVGHDVAKAFFTTNALLEIDENGNQRLTMPFEDFYTVTVEQTVAGTDAPNITFGTPASGTVAEPYQRDTDLNPADADKSWTSGFYGINGEPSEAAGTVRYFEEKNGITSETNTFEREWEFQGAYGMKKDE